jgi:hypothetical protein
LDICGFTIQSRHVQPKKLQPNVYIQQWVTSSLKQLLYAAKEKYMRLKVTEPSELSEKVCKFDSY